MSLFDVLIVQPIFNVLILIYGLLPGADFGIAVILFTILIRLLMWPLVKKQLHQTKVMRQLQPELKKIKAKAKGNRQLEGQLMMELYRERGVNPFGSLGLLLVQLPIFIALYQVIRIITESRGDIARFTYGFVEQLGPIRSVIENPDTLRETLFGFVNLSFHAFEGGGLYIPVALLAVVAAALQYIQAKQITPEPESGKRLRDIFKQQTKGQQVDQSEMTAAISHRMLVILPVVTLVISLYLPGALVLYFAMSSLVAVVQQHMLLKEDVSEMEDMASKPSAAERAKKAKEAEIVAPPSSEPKTSSKPKKHTSQRHGRGKKARRR